MNASIYYILTEISLHRKIVSKKVTKRDILLMLSESG